MFFPLMTAVVLATSSPQGAEAGPFVRALWFVQQYGTVEAVDPANDRRLKGSLAKAMGKDGAITFPKLDGFIQSETFSKLAGSDNRLQAEEINGAVLAAAPESRNRLLPRVREHAAFLTTAFDMIQPEHRLSGEKLVEWIVKNHQPGRNLDIIAVCTANSRRSLFAATMGNIAADYYGMPEIRFHSGGTAASAINAARDQLPQGNRRRDRADRERKHPGAPRKPGIPSCWFGGGTPAHQAFHRRKRLSFRRRTTIRQIPSVVLRPWLSAAKPTPSARS